MSESLIGVLIGGLLVIVADLLRHQIEKKERFKKDQKEALIEISNLCHVNSSEIKLQYKYVTDKIIGEDDIDPHLKIEVYKLETLVRIYFVNTIDEFNIYKKQLLMLLDICHNMFEEYINMEKIEFNPEWIKKILEKIDDIAIETENLLKKCYEEIK